MFFNNKKRNRNKVNNLAATASTNIILSPKGYNYRSLSFCSEYESGQIDYDDFSERIANVFFAGAIKYISFLKDLKQEMVNIHNSEKDLADFSTYITAKNVTEYYALINLMKISIDVIKCSSGNVKLLFSKHALDLSMMRSYFCENDYQKIVNILSSFVKDKCDKDDILDWVRATNPKRTFEQITNDEFDLFMQRLVLCRELKDAGKPDFDAYNQQLDANGDGLDGDVMGELIRSYEKYADIADQIKRGTYRNADGELVKIPQEMQGMANIIERYADIGNN